MAATGTPVNLGPCDGGCCDASPCNQSVTGKMATVVQVSPHGADVVLGSGTPFTGFTWADGVDIGVPYAGTNCDWNTGFGGGDTRVELVYDSGVGKWVAVFVYAPAFPGVGGHIGFYLDTFDPCSTDQTVSVTEAPGTSGTWTYPSEIRIKSCGCGCIAGMMGVGPAAMRASLPLLRTDRCVHLGKRTEFRSGCGGMKCGHACALGLPAVPAGFCQTCESYLAEPGEPWIG